jgi:Holliday junction DNA helicase RuvA
MIDYFRGTLVSKTLNNAVVEVNGTGYDVNITVSSSEKLPQSGHEIKLYIVESTGMYGGVVSHYGFLSKEEREMFLLIKDEVPAQVLKKQWNIWIKYQNLLPILKTPLFQKIFQC